MAVNQAVNPAGVQIPHSAPCGVSSIGIEHWSTKPEVIGSNPIRRTTKFVLIKEDYMKDNFIPKELQYKARMCRTSEELFNLAKEEGLELSDKDLDSIAGG